MTEEIINEMYLLAVKSKLQRGAITVEDRLAYILNELDLQANTIQPNVSSPIVTVPTNNTTPPQTDTKPEPAVDVTPQVLNLEVTMHKYAQQPEDDGFLNRELETTKDLGVHIYDIHLTTDPNTAFYELIADSDLSAEYLRSPSLVPEHVVVFDTKPASPDNQLVKVSNGRLQKNGKLWKIVEPCHMKWC